MVSDFKFILTILDEDGNVDEELELYNCYEAFSNDKNVELYVGTDYEGEPSINVFINNTNNMKNKKMTLKATNIKTQKSIEKNIYR